MGAGLFNLFAPFKTVREPAPTATGIRYYTSNRRIYQRVITDILHLRSKTCRGGFTNNLKGYLETKKPAPTPRETVEIIVIMEAVNRCAIIESKTY